VDFPEQSPKSWHFLNESEAAFVVARIEYDRADTFAQPFTLHGYVKNFRDSKVWAFATLYMLTTTNSYSIAYFMPIILEDGMGFGEAKAQCLTAPPYIAAAVVMYIQAIYADRWRSRGPLVAGNSLLGLTPILDCLHPLLTAARHSGPWSLGLFETTCPTLLWSFPCYHIL
jgi:hypothetical protein